ncbi:PREDICTED: formate dehydrogenase 2, mitochondrial-like [Ipomoea nil]|uniref:formate dehydrogenase 2, mitochondrial-like n=1 Tax=Ipomoea nil TaxID=35883 RepID=UPI0009013B9B|nr:PREDICTED: formate dehydrogenase 2, mitochondrial-like [Ipomoea nil]
MEPELEKEIGAKFEEDLGAMLSKCDVVVINMPLTDKTRGMFDKNRIAKMKKGVLIVNNARGAIMDTQAVVDAYSSGHIAGYSGDVWNPQPAPKDHPWRYMPNQAMTPHISGTTIDGQLCYAAGVKDMLDTETEAVQRHPGGLHVLRRELQFLLEIVDDSATASVEAKVFEGLFEVGNVGFPFGIKVFPVD